MQTTQTSEASGNTAKYKRILLKLSGEAISGGKEGIINFDFLTQIAETVKKLTDKGVEVAILVGAGNIWRGKNNGIMDRSKADHMGMLATVINSIAIEDTFRQCGVDAVAMSSRAMDAFAEYYTSDKADRLLDAGKVVILGGGTGNPCFTTDTAAVLRGIEIHADAVLMAKNIDGVYSDDPASGRAGIIKYNELKYSEIIERGLRVIDMTATVLAKDNNICVYIFALKQPDNILKIVDGEKIGTEIKN